MIVQIRPPLALETPKRKAYAHFLIDYSIEEHLMWVCFLDSNGECWTFENPEIRIQSNPTIGWIYGKGVCHGQEGAKSS